MTTVNPHLITLASFIDRMAAHEYILPQAGGVSIDRDTLQAVFELAEQAPAVEARVADLEQGRKTMLRLLGTVQSAYAALQDQNAALQDERDALRAELAKHAAID